METVQSNISKSYQTGNGDAASRPETCTQLVIDSSCVPVSTLLILAASPFLLRLSLPGAGVVDEPSGVHRPCRRLLAGVQPTVPPPLRVDLDQSQDAAMVCYTCGLNSLQVLRPGTLVCGGPEPHSDQWQAGIRGPGLLVAQPIVGREHHLGDPVAFDREGPDRHVDGKFVFPGGIQHAAAGVQGLQSPLGKGKRLRSRRYA